jgi:hypothetical protein
VSVIQLISGALIAGYLTIGLFFLRYWKSTHDRLLILFASAFGILAFERILLAITHPTTEDALYLYIVRLIAFIIILIAIVDKNRT